MSCLSWSQCFYYYRSKLFNDTQAMLENGVFIEAGYFDLATYVLKSISRIACFEEKNGKPEMHFLQFFFQLFSIILSAFLFSMEIFFCNYDFHSFLTRQCSLFLSKRLLQNRIECMTKKEKNSIYQMKNECF